MSSISFSYCIYSVNVRVYSKSREDLKKMEKYYTVKDVSERTGISAYTLRYYDKEGLLTFVKRDASGRRLFTEDDFQPLYTIAVLKIKPFQVLFRRIFVHFSRKSFLTHPTERICFRRIRKEESADPAAKK